MGAGALQERLGTPDGAGRVVGRIGRSGHRHRQHEPEQGEEAEAGGDQAIRSAIPHGATLPRLIIRKAPNRPMAATLDRVAAIGTYTYLCGVRP
ncbi:hypothetical protein GCM10010109_61710 [Actinoplanes campanulatus]|nr:hypothetical protein GCM10010109_61710 [Actinoplanes campanulatus]GID42012.1 hypothetical protein Aca09nite_85180 [Actinoplanes campanulatus]